MAAAGDAGWPAITGQVEQALPNTPNATEGQLLARLAFGAAAAREGRAAARLVRMRWARRPLPKGETLLAAARGQDGLWLLGPMRLPLRRPGVSCARFAEIVRKAREDIQAERDSDGALHELGSILFPEGAPGGLLRVACDGALAGAPVLAASRAAGMHIPVPPLVAVACGRLQESWTPPQNHDVASLADAQGDLPFAAHEVDGSKATVLLRGAEVTRAALRNLGPKGLIHLGVHARRERGVPMLALYDGWMDSAEVQELRLQGRPIVLLSGCATGEGPAYAGVEQSLAAAFLKAGASSVIATLWPVQDEDMNLIVRQLVSFWPFHQAVVAVIATSEKLRRAGAPASLWAALVVYP
jgi:hypothetical protein